jgi:hypothetical protein
VASKPEVDEYVSSTDELRNHIKNYDDRFTVCIDSGTGVDITKTFREEQISELNYEGFKMWSIKPDKKGENIPNLSSNNHLNIFSHSVSYDHLKYLCFILLLGIALETAYFTWYVFEDVIRNNGSFFSLLGLLIPSILAIPQLINKYEDKNE